MIRLIGDIKSFFLHCLMVVVFFSWGTAEAVILTFTPSVTQVTEGGSFTVEVFAEEEATGVAGCQPLVSTTGTAQNTVDYNTTLTSGALGFTTTGVPGHNQSWILTYNITDDGLLEGTETISVGSYTGSEPTCPDIKLSGYTVNVLDKKRDLTTSFIANQIILGSGSYTATPVDVGFSLQGSGSPDSNCEAQAIISRVGGTAIPGVDFNFTPQTINFSNSSDGDSKTESVDVDIINGTGSLSGKTIILQAEFENVIANPSLGSSCPLVAGSSPRQVELTLEYSLASLDATITPTITTVQAGAGPTKVVDILIQQTETPIDPSAYCEASFDVEFVGGSAVLGTDFALSSPISFNGANNSSPMPGSFYINILPGVIGDGDKTLELRVIYDSINSSRNCSYNSITPSDTVFITIKDTPVKDLTGSLIINSSTLQESEVGTALIGSLNLTLPTGEEADAHCNATAKVSVVDGTAEAGTHFNFIPATLALNEGDNNQSIPLNLEVLPGAAGDGDKTVILEAIFSSDGLNGVNSCPLVSTTPQRQTVTITDSPVKDLTGSLSITTSTLQESVIGNTAVGSLSLTLPATEEADAHCNATAEVSVVGGTAEAGTHFNFIPATLTLNEGDNNQSIPLNLEVLPGAAGDGDKTVILEAILSSDGLNGVNSCPLVSTTPQRQTVTITDSPVKDLTGSLSITTSTLQESVIGNTAVGSLSLTLPATEEADAHCNATAEVSVVGGTAEAGTHFNFTPATLTLNEGDNNQSIPLNLEVLPGAAGDGDKTVILEAIFSSDGLNGVNSCPLASTTPQRQTITLTDSPVTNLTGSLSITTSTLQESVIGNTAVGSLSLTLPATEEADAHCNATAEVSVVGGTAEAGTHFNFTPATLTLNEGDNNQSIPLNLEVLPGAAGDGDKTVILEAIFSSDGLNGVNSCPLVSITPQRQTVTITDSPVKALTGFMRETVSRVDEGAGEVKVSELVFELTEGMSADANCKATAAVTLAGGTARDGQDFTFAPVTLEYGVGDPATKTQPISLNALSGDVGDGDRTVQLKATFTSLGGANGNSCPFDTRSVTKTITISDDPYVPLSVSVALDKALPGEGETVNVVVNFSEATARGLMARSIDSCQVSAKWTQTGSASEADYRFGFPETLTYITGQPQIKLPLEFLSDDLIESDETFGLSLQLGTEGVTTPCPIGDGGAATPSETVELAAVALRDTTDTTVAGKDPEPEALLDRSCDALEQRVLSPVGLSTEDQAFFDSNCGDEQVVDRNFEPEEVASQSNAVIIGADRQLNNIRARLDRLRSGQGQRGVDISGTRFNIQGASIPGAALALNGAAGDIEESELLADSRWGIFTNGEYAFGKKKHSGSDLNTASGDRKFDFNSTGVTVGADYRFPGEKYFAGAALGYKDFDADFTTQAGNTSNKGYNLSFYGTYLVSDKSYVDALISFGKSQIDSRRPVNNDGSQGEIATFAISSPDAREIAVSIGGGYEFNQGELTLTPYGRVDYTKGTIDAYTEQASDTSAATSMFSINEQDIDSLTSTLGIKASRTISTSSGVFVPQASVEWKHEFKDRSAISGTSTYLSGADLGVTGNFTEESADAIDRDYFNVNVGVSAVFPKGKSGYLNLESRFGDDQIKDTAVKAGFRWEF